MYFDLYATSRGRTVTDISGWYLMYWDYSHDLWLLDFGVDVDATPRGIYTVGDDGGFFDAMQPFDG